MVTIVSIEKVRSAVERAEALHGTREEAVHAAAQALGIEVESAVHAKLGIAGKEQGNG